MGARSWHEKTEFWQALTTRTEQQPLSCVPTADDFAVARGHLLKIELNDQERRVAGRLLTERKALLIETTEDTTQPDSARRAGSIELSVIESILGKLRLRDLTSIAASAKRLGAAEGVESFPDPHSLACASRPDCLQHPLEALGWRLGGSGENGTPTTSEAGRRTTGVSESVYDHCDPSRRSASRRIE